MQRLKLTHFLLRVGREARQFGLEVLLLGLMLRELLDLFQIGSQRSQFHLDLLQLLLVGGQGRLHRGALLARQLLGVLDGGFLLKNRVAFGFEATDRIVAQ